MRWNPPEPEYGDPVLWLISLLPAVGDDRRKAMREKWKKDLRPSNFREYRDFYEENDSRVILFLRLLSVGAPLILNQMGFGFVCILTSAIVLLLLSNHLSTKRQELESRRLIQQSIKEANIARDRAQWMESKKGSGPRFS
ncbi:hypothetical protein [Halorubrum distributum]|uniref:hypothetical protein n=1 Tax=Halorubrum distributum TaxID=29283 RepID=UPI000677B3AD|nr:hypothetical protein [Halorubrum arcis]